MFKNFLKIYFYYAHHIELKLGKSNYPVFHEKNRTGIAVLESTEKMAKKTTLCHDGF